MLNEIEEIERSKLRLIQYTTEKRQVTEVDKNKSISEDDTPQYIERKEISRKQMITGSKQACRGKCTG
jgi:hypothetical protein